MQLNIKYNFLILILAILVSAVTSSEVKAQGQVKSIMFTGRVVGVKGTQTLGKAYILIPRAGRGTLADEGGYFALPVFPGDSIVFSYLGYQKQYHIIPRRHMEESYSAIILMKEDVKTLAEVKVYPYATEEEFKKAFVAMKLPDEFERANLEQNTRQELLMQMAAVTPLSAAGNYRNFMDQQIFGRENAANRSFTTAVPFLNPFAWAKFINSVKNGDLKKKEYRSILNQAPRESITRQDVMKK
ncbi:carboxypeptidase-like regulatory domain-containing protein [Runella rosea]|uniref:Carboxypeptidase-like regulatory domain-containing protein n=2 Tax=Runella TaxID=105 RepID=A0A344THM9_9BACT|nr:MULTISPECIES: carboxypeptidase-like regulatory domain-containing protein [Runella]AXE18150.1 carboxypeptidase-like regulatory domain-containing protein [Runella rosea]MCP1381391.1 carboxypeptidase-like regulatory domain-containing protein [Runella salmonicolor]NBB21193.1 carboxypeptidase-like regulatory domain-containing protein [Runella sp. CRIBMP]